MFIDLFAAKKIKQNKTSVALSFKLNMYMFFYQISRIFSRYLVIL